jgi:hypothetical protein
VIGASASLGPVIGFSDAAIFAMAEVNILALSCLMPIVKRQLNSCLERLNSGQFKRYWYDRRSFSGRWGLFPCRARHSPQVRQELPPV